MRLRAVRGGQNRGLRLGSVALRIGGRRIRLRAHSDAAYVMGLAALICELTDGLSAAEAMEIDTSFPHEIPCVYPMTELRLSSMEKMLLKIKECTKNIL